MKLEAVDSSYNVIRCQVIRSEYLVLLQFTYLTYLLQHNRNLGINSKISILEVGPGNPSVSLESKQNPHFNSPGLLGKQLGVYYSIIHPGSLI